MSAGLHICGPAMREISRTQDGDLRWCFHCRRISSFDLIVDAPADPMSYYGPSPRIECTHCHVRDADMFPGRYREWDQ